MKQLLLICAVVALVGCGESAEEKAAKAAAEAKIIEAAIRKELQKPEGELTKADLEKVKELYLSNNQLTDVTGLEKLTQLKVLDLKYNPDLAKAQIAQLQKALPKCRIYSNPKK
jgi:Leucine-rich repeat (LRR) protein